MSFESLLVHTCDIARKTVSKTNAYGNMSYTFATVASSVRCRIDGMAVTSGFIVQNASGQSNGNDYVGYFSKDANIQSGDRVYWTDMGIYLYAKPIMPESDSNGFHHKEVPLGLQET